MRRSFRHRMLCALAALSIAFTATPVTVAVMAAEGDLPACSVSDGPSVTATAGPEAAHAATAAGADLDPRAQPCGPGPCSMSFAACAAGGACLSVVPLPAGASPSLSSGLLGVVAVGPDDGLPTPASAIITPPPRS